MSMFPPELESTRMDVSTAQMPAPTDEERRIADQRSARAHLFVVTVVILAASLALVDAKAQNYLGAVFGGALIGVRWGGNFSAVKDVYLFYAIPASLFMLLLVGLKNEWLL